MLRHCLLAALVVCALAPALAQDPPPLPGKQGPSLQLGDKAPALAIEKWLKGEPVKSFEKGKVYVVEFWATWCGPCIQSMPHLTELQKKHKEKGLRIISVTSEDPNNSLEKVEAMVKKQGDEKMGYTVAWDKGRATNEAFMEAAGQNGIPCAFIVNGEGSVAYIGHPMGMDKPLEAILAGKYDIAKAREAGKLKASLQRAFQKRDWEAALTTIDAVLKADPEGEQDLHAQKFFILLLPMKQHARAYALGRELLEKQLKDQAMPLNAMAWTILDSEEVTTRDVTLALAMAKRSSELTGDKDPQVLDTLALAHHKNGDSKKALELQKKALDLAGEGLKDELEGRLKTYREAVDKKQVD
jgi:thiol-disulfide isomerase/thioredoxin